MGENGILSTHNALHCFKNVNCLSFIANSFYAFAEHFLEIQHKVMLLTCIIQFCTHQKLSQTNQAQGRDIRNTLLTLSSFSVLQATDPNFLSFDLWPENLLYGLNTCLVRHTYQRKKMKHKLTVTAKEPPTVNGAMTALLSGSVLMDLPSLTISDPSVSLAVDVSDVPVTLSLDASCFISAEACPVVSDKVLANKGLAFSPSIPTLCSELELCKLSRLLLTDNVKPSGCSAIASKNSAFSSSSSNSSSSSSLSWPSSDSGKSGNLDVFFRQALSRVLCCLAKASTVSSRLILRWRSSCKLFCHLFSCVWASSRNSAHACYVRLRERIFQL